MSRAALRKVETTDRFIWLDGRDYYVKVEFSPGLFVGTGTWTAVELDRWGGFRRRLFDGRTSVYRPPECSVCRRRHGQEVIHETE